ncbi:MAG: hypothetical protein Cons2KO_01060 [Congregibacter sp.]
MNEKLRQTATTWIAVYPIITCLIASLEPVIGDWPIPIRTLLLSGVMVPLMVFWAVPTTNRLIKQTTGFLAPLEQKSEG